MKNYLTMAGIIGLIIHHFKPVSMMKEHEGMISVIVKDAITNQIFLLQLREIKSEKVVIEKIEEPAKINNEFRFNAN